MAILKTQYLYYYCDKVCRRYLNRNLFKNMNRIVAFGNPLLDTIVIIKDNSLLTKYNLSRDGQREISQSEMELLSRDTEKYEKTICAGGCAQNTLKVVQWLLRKQCSTIIFGAIGNDNQGRTLQQILKNDGVETNYIKQDNHNTGVTVALVNGAYRSLVASLGAAEILSLADFKSNSKITDQIDKSDLVYMEGFFLPKRTEVANFILNYCTLRNKVFAFNTSGEYMCKELPETVLHFMERANIIFGNKNEFEAISAFAQQNSVEVFLKNVSKGGKTVIMTDGPQCVLCVADGGKVLEKVVVPTMKETEIVDTTGAGDSFVAGFLVGHLLKRSLVNCVELGCYAAQEIIKKRGCTIPAHPPGVLL